jgi:hypothetical protein
MEKPWGGGLYHVIRGAQARDALRRGVIDGEPEVGHFAARVDVRDEEILRFDVAMDDVAGVKVPMLSVG